MATTASNFKEDWKSNTLSAGKWLNWGSPQVSVVSQTMRITNTLTTSYFGIDYNDQLDLTGSSVFVEVIDAGNMSLATTETTVMDLQLDTSNRVFWLLANDAILPYKTVAGTSTQLATLAYNATNHRYFRIRESGGTTYWEYASQAEVVVGTWNVLYSEANPIVLTNLLFELSLGAYAIDSGTRTVVWGSMNVLPGSRQIQKPDIRPYPFSPCRAR
jgi:hypothetical protein